MGFLWKCRSSPAPIFAWNCAFSPNEGVTLHTTHPKGSFCSWTEWHFFEINYGILLKMYVQPQIFVIVCLQSPFSCSAAMRRTGVLCQRTKNTPKEHSRQTHQNIKTPKDKTKEKHTKKHTKNTPKKQWKDTSKDTKKRTEKHTKKDDKHRKKLLLNERHFCSFTAQTNHAKTFLFMNRKTLFRVNYGIRLISPQTSSLVVTIVLTTLSLSCSLRQENFCLLTLNQYTLSLRIKDCARCSEWSPGREKTRELWLGKTEKRVRESESERVREWESERVREWESESERVRGWESERVRGWESERVRESERVKSDCLVLSRSASMDLRVFKIERFI